MANQYPRGAKLSPRHKAFEAQAHVPIRVPSFYLKVPPELSFWGNNVYGDCVSAEEAAAKAIYSVEQGKPELFIPDNVLVAWAGQHGFLNGADLTQVMDVMISQGITVNGVTYKDGPYQSVNWTNNATISSAIYHGPVKIAVAADQLQNTIQTIKNGWFASGYSEDTNYDHCVNLCGYGTARQLATILGSSVPNSLANAEAYALFTWSTIGIITRTSMIKITGEAWLRVPTTC